MLKSGKTFPKTHLFKNNVISIFLCGSEYSKITKTTNHRLEVFQNRCLRNILKIFWPNTISNAELHPTHYIRDKTTQISEDWPCLENVAHNNSPNCSQIDTGWKTGERKTERNLAKNGGARNERTLPDLGKARENIKR